MAITGPEGMNLPAIMDDGVSSSDWQELNSRFFTEHRREPFMPNFAIGISQALGNPTLSRIELQRRITVSLEDSYLSATGVEVAINGSVYRIDARLEVPAGAP